MTTTRDRERLDADAMKTQRMDNSIAPVTGASEGGGKVVAHQLGARDVLVNNAGISLDSKLPNSAGVEASAMCVRRTYRDCRGDGPVPAGNGNHLGTAGSAPPILLGGFIVVVARRSLRCGVAPVKQIAGIG
jgi:NAD(P)-dependent dehydrogenase (short-subunit alcohol dehydrogenase family)